MRNEPKIDGRARRGMAGMRDVRRRLAILAVALLALSASAARAGTVGGQISPSAPCDGTSDRTLAIQAAIANAVSSGSNTVYISAGTGACIISGTIALPSNVTLKGDGRGRTVIRLAATVIGVPMVQNSDTFNSNTGISLLDLTLDGNGADPKS